MFVFGCYLRFQKMFGNYCLGVELGHSETIIIRTNGERICSKLNFLTSLLPYFLTSLLLYFRTSLLPHFLTARSVSQLPPSSPNSAPDPKVWREAPSQFIFHNPYVVTRGFEFMGARARHVSIGFHKSGSVVTSTYYALRARHSVLQHCSLKCPFGIKIAGPSSWLNKSQNGV